MSESGISVSNGHTLAHIAQLSRALKAELCTEFDDIGATDEESYHLFEYWGTGALGISSYHRLCPDISSFLTFTAQVLGVRYVSDVL